MARFEFLTETNEIMQAAREEGVSKFEVLEYFGSSFKQESLLIFQKLLIRYFSPEEIAKRYKTKKDQRVFKNTERVKDIILFSEKIWVKLTDPNEILKTKTLNKTAKEDLYLKLSYFIQNDKKIFNELVKIVGEKKILETFSDDKGLIQFMGSTALWDFLNELSEKERSEQTSKRKEEIDAICKTVTKKNVWHVICHHANDAVVFHVLKNRYRKLLKETVADFRYKDNTPVENRNHIAISYLVYDIELEIKEEKKAMEKKEKQQKSEEERLINKERKRLRKIERNENLIYEGLLFTVNGVEITSMEDCRILCEKFLATDLTLLAFCEKYKIQTIVGFRDMLQVMAEYDHEFANEIEKKMSLNAQQYIVIALQIVKEVAAGKRLVKEMLRFARTYKFAQLVNFAKKYIKNQSVIDSFILRVTDYYYSRLNSYDNSTDIENLEKFLSYDEVMFIKGKEEFYFEGASQKIDPGYEFYKAATAMDAKHNQIIKD